MATFLEGVAVCFYRGIGPQTQYIAPFSMMNFFIGPNNAGKSIILNLLAQRVSKDLTGDSQRQLNAAENYRGAKTGEFFLAVGKKKEDIIAALNVELEKRRQGVSLPLQTAITTIVDRISVNELVWIHKVRANTFSLHSQTTIEDARNWVKSTEWNSIWHALTGATGGGMLQNWIPDTFSAIARYAQPALPPIHLIPAKRQLGSKGESFNDLSGRGLIDHLATLQNPSFDRQNDRERFQRINAFLREITGKPDALLEVPSEREHLLVHMDNKVLPLSSLGTGIHEVVLIAAFCTIHDKSIMCIEEPEIHLHPLLQRKLMNYLTKNTSSQYFIATHSSAFIDTPDSSIFHVSNDGVQTFIRSVLTKSEQRAILDDLGCHASDILQSNAVIWVEGPSDRIYLNHWINALDARLAEGIHYTIMFYGGGLIRHLTASDDALEEFIRLRDMNRNMAIVIDSDRGAASDALKPHAKRLSEEMSKDGGVAWITAGREVENYVNGEKLQAVLKELHPKLYKEPSATGQYDHAFYFLRDDPKNSGEQLTYKDGDKVGAAILVCQEPPNLDMLDLRVRLEELIQMIRAANGLGA